MKESILKKLEDERVFSIKKNDDGSYRFREECDEYFKCNLSKIEMMQLIEELKECLKD